MSERPARRRWVQLGPFGGLLALAFVAAGLIVIGLGWNGAATYPDIRRQFPFLISGGLLGLGLVVFGSALMIVQSAREDRSRLEERLTELTGLLGHGVGLPEQAAPVLPGDAAGLVVAGSTSYHLPECRLVSSRDTVTYLTTGEANAQGLAPCRICRPAAADGSGLQQLHPQPR